MSDYSNYIDENLPKEENTVNAAAPGQIITEKMLYYLQGASPWLRFVSISGFVMLGFSLIGLLIMVAGGEYFDELGMGESGSFFVFVTFLPVLAIGFFCLFFSLQFGNKIKIYLQTKDQAELENAFKNNKALWTLSGVTMIISLAIFGLAVVAGLIAAAFAF